MATGVAVAEGDDGLPSGQLGRVDGQGLAGCPAETGDGDHFDRVCSSRYCVLCLSPVYLTIDVIKGFTIVIYLNDSTE